MREGEAAAWLCLDEHGDGREDPDRQPDRQKTVRMYGVRQKGGVWFKTSLNGIWVWMGGCLLVWVLYCIMLMCVFMCEGPRVRMCKRFVCNVLECFQACVWERQTVGSHTSGPHTCIHQSLGRGWANRSIITSEEHSLTDANPWQDRGRQKEG